MFVPSSSSAGRTLASIAAYLATATLAAGTLTASAPMTLTQTWNNAGVAFIGKSNAFTDTTSASGSLLEQWLVGGNNVLSLRRAFIGSKFDRPVFTIGAATGAAPGYGYFAVGAAGFLGIGVDENANGATISSGGNVSLALGASLSWTNNATNVPSGTADLFLRRDAANTLAQRNLTTAQRAKWFNAWTDASNGEWFDIDWITNANELTLKTNANGTGTVRGLRLSGNNGGIRITSSGIDFNNDAHSSTFWRITTAGHFIAPADDTYNLGASLATRPQYANISKGVMLGTAQVATTFLGIGASTTAKSQINLATGAAPSAPVDGDIWREDNTNTGLKVRINGVTKTITVA